MGILRRRSINLMLILVLIIITSGLYLFNLELGKRMFDIRTVVGPVIGVQQKTILIKDIWLAGYSGSMPKDLEMDIFKFSVDERTRFRKTEMKMPTPADLESGRIKNVTIEKTESGAKIYKYDAGDIPKTESSSSLDDLARIMRDKRASVMLRAEFPSTVYKTENPLATDVIYEVTYSNPL